MEICAIRNKLVVLFAGILVAILCVAPCAWADEGGAKCGGESQPTKVEAPTEVPENNGKQIEQTVPATSDPAPTPAESVEEQGEAPKGQEPEPPTEPVVDSSPSSDDASQANPEPADGGQDDPVPSNGGQNDPEVSNAKPADPDPVAGEEGIAEGADASDAEAAIDPASSAKDTAAPQAAPAAAKAASPAEKTAATSKTTKTQANTTVAPKTAAAASSVKVSPTRTAPAASTAAPKAKTTAAKTASAYKPIIANGTYYIESRLNLENVLGYRGGSNAANNVQNNAYTGKVGQRWTFTFNDKTGTYQIINAASKLALDVAKGVARDEANVQQYKPNRSKAQQWFITKVNGTYVIASAANKRFVLDVAYANMAAGANVQLFTKNNTNSQKWYLIPSSTTKRSTNGPEDGLYTICRADRKSMVLDVDEAGIENGKNVQLYKGNGTPAQKWIIASDDKGHYTIINLNSGKALDIEKARTIPKSNVQQYSPNGSTAQKWIFKAHADGSYSIISCLNGIVALDLKGNGKTNGANLQTYFANNSAAQKFTLKKASMFARGINSIAPMSDRKNTLTGTSGKPQAKEYTGVLNQKFVVSYDKANHAYLLMFASSGKYLSQDGSGKSLSSSKALRWKPRLGRTGVVLVNMQTQKALEFSGSLKSVPVKAYKNAQNFAFTRRPVLEDGAYFLNSYLGDAVLDIRGTQKANGTNVQIGKKSGAMKQRFVITKVGSYYKIENGFTQQALDVERGSKKNRANVQLWDFKNANAQLWKIEISKNGGLVFTNKASGKVLDVAGGKNASGTNVQSYQRNESKSQRWSVTPTTTLSPIELRALQFANKYGSNTKYYLSVDYTNRRTIIFERPNSNAAWTLKYNWRSILGKEGTRTPTGRFTLGGGHYQTQYPDSLSYTAYYYRNIKGGYWFHSVMYSTRGNYGHNPFSQNVSAGCVRLDLDNAKWLYYNVDRGTSGYVYW